MIKGGIQLPDDAESTGYRQTKPFHFEQVFKSESKNFEGTELEFVKAGLSYRYVEIDDFKRLVLKG